MCACGEGPFGKKLVMRTQSCSSATWRARAYVGRVGRFVHLAIFSASLAFRTSVHRNLKDGQTSKRRAEGRKEGRKGDFSYARAKKRTGAGWRAGDAGHKMADSLPPSLLSSDNNFDRRAG